METYYLYDINPELRSWLFDILEYNKCKLKEERWQSKYNKYVYYDYEPYCTDGFICNIYFEAPTEQHARFIEHLYQKRLQGIKMVFNMYQKTKEKEENRPMKVYSI